MPSDLIPPRADHPVHGHFWVPIDDDNCWAWSFDYKVTRPMTEKEFSAMRAGQGIHTPVDAAYRPLANKDNDYLMDRAAQKAGKTYSGIEGFAIQDSSLQESMGPICDRTKENLVSTDNGIIMARHRLMRAAKALAEKEGEGMAKTIGSAQKPAWAAWGADADVVFCGSKAGAMTVGHSSSRVSTSASAPPST